MLQNNQILYLIVLMLVVPFLVSCTTAPPPDTSAADAESIRAASSQFADRFNSHDMAALASAYSADARVIPPNLEMIVGRDNIQALFEQFNANIELTITDLQVSGDMGYVLGEYTLVFPTEEGDPVTDTGNYVEIWKKVNGTWMFDLDIWNTNISNAMPDDGMMEEKETMEEE